MEKHEGPLPAALMAPWLMDNAAFQREMQNRSLRIGDLSSVRTQIQHKILMTDPAEPCALGAVDAASIVVPFGDQISILLQVVHVDGAGTPNLTTPERVTGIDSEENRLAIAPMRVAAECAELAKVTSPTIADTSYWSFLMEVNDAIRRTDNSASPALENAVKRLIDDGAFIGMMKNPFVVPMSKSSQSDKCMTGISDRETYSRILEAGEYTIPTKLIDGTTGGFGIEKRRFKLGERELLRDLYHEGLGVLFYKPHPWTRAFRVESHLNRLENSNLLMPLLAAIKSATASARNVVEPWPQFMADHIAKQLSAIGALYGELNWHRYPVGNYVPIRTTRK